MSCQKLYISILVKHPYLVLLVISVFSCICLILPLTVKQMNFPSFQDPQEGFSTRHTSISNRLTAWHNLQEEIRPSGSLIRNPVEYLIANHYLNISTPSNEYYVKRKGGRRKHKKSKDKYPLLNGIDEDQKNITVYGKIITNERNSTDAPEMTNKWIYIQNLTEHNPNSRHISYEKQFCGTPDEKYVHLVVTSANKENLFTWKNIRSLCKLEDILMNSKVVPDICISNSEIGGECCKPWSLPNYIAALFEKDSCIKITEAEINKTMIILEECTSHFRKNEQYVDCIKRKDCDLPMQCVKHDAVYNILNYLTSTSFFPQNIANATFQKLEETIMFLPIAASLASVPLYHEVEKLGKEFEGLSIVAMDFGIKSMIFDEYLLWDSRLMGLGAFFVFMCVWIYTASIFLTVMTIISIFIVVIVTYFLYEVVYEISFFPFMNMLTVVICIGIGADNAFILCKMWHLNKLDEANNNDMSKIMLSTFNHAFKSMFVTSLTTAVAFWGSCISSVTAISCFSIYAGTAIIINFLMTISWIPACLVIWEQSCLSKSIFPYYLLALDQICCCLKCRWTFTPKCRKWFGIIWSSRKDFLIKLVITLRYFWIVCFTTIALASTFVVFVNPGLGLPTSMDFQLFHSGHPFETYDFIYKQKFWFHKDKTENIFNQYVMPLRFIWGVLPVDNGDYLNPANLGSLELDPSFDMTDPESQMWLKDFCSKIKMQPFYQNVFGVSFTSCFIETFASSMNRRCYDDFSRKNRTPCCRDSKFPFDRNTFNSCIIDEMAEVYKGPAKFVYPKTAGAMFSKEKNPVIKAVVVEFDSNVSFTMSYQNIDEFYVKVNEWAKLELSTAPPTMKNGFFISDLSFYDLQGELSKGTKISILVSMTLATTVLILSTLNLLLTFLAIVTITFTIVTTIGGLVLCGWTLNILESVAISSAIGLAVDCSLHYCINYKLSPPDRSRSRIEATQYSLSCLMGPSFMACLTTGAAGFFMLFSSILPYFQIGLFLTLIMTISWLFGTFFLGSLLATMGPVQNCCQYSYRQLCSRMLGYKNKPIRHGANDAIASTSSTTDLDKVSFIKHDTPIPIKKKTSLREPSVRYTPNQVLTDQSPSSNVTIIMADGITEDN